jgi:hypothetical protein
LPWLITVRHRNLPIPACLNLASKVIRQPFNLKTTEDHPTVVVLLGVYQFLYSKFRHCIHKILSKIDTDSKDVLVKLMILEYTKEDLFKQLFNWQAEQAGFPKELAAMETAAEKKPENLEEVLRTAGQGWISSSARQWIAMKPQLSTTDLRDYFWIARDRLESTFSGLSMVSPATRAVLNDLLAGTSPKRRAGAKSAQSLSTAEAISLFELLDQAVTRHPEEKKNFDAYRALVEQQIPGAAERLNAILLNVPLAQVSPAVGLDIKTLTKARAELQSVFKPALDRISQSTEKIGKAVLGANGGGKK